MKTYTITLDSAEITCKPNSILSSRISAYLLANGHIIDRDPRKADYIIINTCGFDQTRENLSHSLFKKYFSAKDKRTRIISVGCLNRINRSAVKNNFGETIFIDDLNRLDEIFSRRIKFSDFKQAGLDPRVLKNLALNAAKGFDLTEKIYLGTAKLFYRFLRPAAGRNLRLEQVLAEAERSSKFYVEISQGCTNNCSYCIIKKARGGLKSRPTEDILNDIGKLYCEDKTLCLVADDCGSYGRDIGTDIFCLLDEINSIHPGLKIDICYLYPFWLEKYETKYLELFRKLPINSVNISLQSGSDRILSLMDRNYSAQKTLKIISNLRRVSPQTLIWTHILIGFPQETERDFQKTLAAIAAFDFSSKFVYSDRNGTKSAAMPGKISAPVKAARKLRLQLKESSLFLGRFLSYLFSAGRSRRR